MVLVIFCWVISTYAVKIEPAQLNKIAKPFKEINKGYVVNNIQNVGIISICIHTIYSPKITFPESINP